MLEIGIYVLVGLNSVNKDNKQPRNSLHKIRQNSELKHGEVPTKLTFEKLI